MSGLGPLALVVNPRATRARGGRGAEVVRALEPLGLDWVLTTRGAGDAAELARQAAAQGARVVVTFGGDGTAAEAAGALAGGPVALVPVPGGNANVFARALGWPPTAERALAALAGIAQAPVMREVHLGRLRADGLDRVFTINAGAGLDAATVEWIEARPRLKHRLRHLGFALGAGATALRARSAPAIAVTPHDEATHTAQAVFVACGSPYTYAAGRPMDIAPGAAFDGGLAWTTLARIRPVELGALAARAVRGRPPVADGVVVRGGVTREGLALSTGAPVPLQADGEPLGRHTEVLLSPGPVLWTVDPRPDARLKSAPA